MSLIGIILLFLVIWYVVRPTVKFFWTVNRLRNRARAAYGDTARQAQPAGRKAGWTTPAPRKKKIERNVGEYIEYEEITITSDTSDTSGSGDHSTRYTAVEQQVTDVEWEDVK